jgi:S-DNA-T family DNA segregation ATPase FtsK/SpoIIIE
MARAAEFILLWATQKPTMDKNGGIDPQISAQITYRAALALSTSGEARVVFGEDATERGWHAHDLDMPGFAMLRSGPKAKPHPIKTRAFSPADVIALPDRPVWERYAEPAAPARPALTLVKGGAEPIDSVYVEDSVYAAPVAVPTVPAPTAPVDRVPAEPATNRDRVLAAIVAGARTAKAVTEATGLNKGTVSREVKALTEAGAVLRAEDGTLTVAAAGEVSA